MRMTQAMPILQPVAVNPLSFYATNIIIPTPKLKKEISTHKKGNFENYTTRSVGVIDAVSLSSYPVFHD